MKTSLIIARIKDRMASRFGTRVSGTAEYIGARNSQESFPVPHAFVMTLPDEPSGPLTNNPITQSIDDRFVVTVAVSNTADPRGQIADDVLREIRDELLAALLNWVPEDDMHHSALIYDGFEIEITNARAWRHFNFKTTFVV